MHIHRLTLKLAWPVLMAAFVVLALMFLLPSKTMADPGSAPFFKINSKFPVPYSVQFNNAQNFDIPQTEFTDTFLPGQKITFAVDYQLLMPPTEMDLKKVKFKIDTGDGHVYDSSSIVHSYEKPGSYIVKLTADKPVAQPDNKGNIEAVLINVVPTPDYHLPQPKIAYEGNILENKGRSFKFDFNSALHFNARYSKDGTAKIVTYQWDFGDSQAGASGVDVQHKYNMQIDTPLMILRTTDQNGLFADTSVLLENSPVGDITATTANKTSPVVTKKKTDIKSRYDNYYRGLKNWLQQTIARFNGKGQPISKKSVALVLLIAAFLGALHSLTPGHSKSIMSAMLIAKKESQFKDVFILATAITFTHTIVIYLLGFFMLVIDKNATLSWIMPYLTKLNIILVFILGAWLISKGVRAAMHRHHHHVHGQEEPGHTHNHSHSHGHHHSHSHHDKSDSLWGYILAGVSGGLVPCIDALSILVLAASVHMVLFGLVIVLFFSLGLAASIIILGILVIRTKKVLGLEEKIGEKISIYAPLLTGIVILLLGIGLVLAG